ncbi:helix-hairpin-helix domain-containing protein [Halobellus sp. EA9]|uniref:helix-hairpin-helix domain-containing protein n=1 Tax=Halobellus sp. EA9 TaxID=3421647 RepID=UPI003EB8AAD2
MSIFDTILSSLRSLIGGGDRSGASGGGSDSGSSRSEGTVSVEHDPDAEPDRSEADPSTESAVKGAAAETDASASTETLVDEAEGREPGEAVETAGEGEEAVETDPDVADVETEDDAAAAETDASASTETLVDEETGKEPAETVADPEAPEEDESEESADEDGPESGPVETLKGIGPAYAERLASVGIETVADLADADVDEITANTDLSETRVTTWIERAREQS